MLRTNGGSASVKLGYMQTPKSLHTLERPVILSDSEPRSDFALPI